MKSTVNVLTARIALADSRCGAFEVARLNNVSTAAQVTNAAGGIKNAMAAHTTSDCSGSKYGPGSQGNAASPPAYPTAIKMRFERPMLPTGTLDLPRPDRRLGSFRASLGRPGPVRQVLNQILKHRRVQFIENRLTASLGNHEASLAQHRQVSQHGRPGTRKRICDFTGTTRTISE